MLTKQIIFLNFNKKYIQIVRFVINYTGRMSRQEAIICGTVSKKPSLSVMTTA